MKLPLTTVSIMNFFFMLGATIILAVQRDLFASGSSSLYVFLEKILPQEGHAIVAFITAIILFTAFIFRNRYIEVAGLFFSGVFMLFLLCGYLTSFPNIASLAFAVWSLATFMSIMEVFNRIEDEKENVK